MTVLTEVARRQILNGEMRETPMLLALIQEVERVTFKLVRVHELVIPPAPPQLGVDMIDRIKVEHYDAVRKFLYQDSK